MEATLDEEALRKLWALKIETSTPDKLKTVGSHRAQVSVDIGRKSLI